MAGVSAFLFNHSKTVERVFIALQTLIARDTMHQQQWLAVLEELGGCQGTLPIPNSFPQSEEYTEFSYMCMTTGVDGMSNIEGRFTSGPSLDGRGEFSARQIQPLREEPMLAPPIPQAFAETQQLRVHPPAPQTMENFKDTIVGSR